MEEAGVTLTGARRLWEWLPIRMACGCNFLGAPGRDWPEDHRPLDAHFAGRRAGSGDRHRPHHAARIGSGKVQRALPEDFWSGSLEDRQAGSRIWFAVGKDQAGSGNRGCGKDAERPPHMRARGRLRQKAGDGETQKGWESEIAPSGDEDVVRFKDLNGLVMELKSGA